MPTISTGNPGWDQNLSTLGNALFPDPSKVGQGYYYGSQARKEQLESNKIIDQQNWRNRYGMMTQGGAQPAPPVYQQMDNVPGAAPVLAAPTNLPYSAAAAAAPVPAGAHNLAATAANMNPAQAATALSTIIPPFTTGQAQAFGAPTPGAPVAPQTTTSNGQAPAEDQGSGPLHPGSITPSDGGLKQSGPAAHDGSPAPMPPGMTLPGLMAMSAAGSLGGLDAASVQQGGQALAYELYSRGTISRDQYHQMLGGSGQPALATADTSAASAANVANINAASAKTTTGMAQAGETQRKGMDLQTVITDPVTGASKLVPLAQMQGQGGTQTFAPAAVAEAVKPIEVQPGGPGTAAFSVPTGQAQKDKSPLYDKTVANTVQTQTGEFGQYIDLKDPLRTIPTTAADARARGLVPVPKTPEQVLATTQQALNNARTDQEKKSILEKYTRLASTPKGPVSAEEADKQRSENYRVNQQLYAIPQTGKINFGVKDNIVFDDEAQQLINDKTEELQGQTVRLRNNPTEAHEQAIRALQAEGKIETPEQVNARRGPARTRLTSVGLAGDDRVTQFAAPGGKGSTDHMVVHAIKPGATPASTTTTRPQATVPGPVTTAPPPSPFAQRTPPNAGVIPSASAPVLSGRPVPPPPPVTGPTPPNALLVPSAPAPRLSNTIVPPAGPAPAASPAPPAAAAPIGRAPAGTPEGATIYYPGTNTVAGVNRGGLVYSQ